MSNVTTVPILRDFQGPWAALRLEIIGPGGSASPLSLPDIYPFQSVTELKRRLWLHHNGDPRWAPENVFLGVRDIADPTRIRPLEFYWTAADTTTLPDPILPEHRVPSPLLVDDAGNRKPVQPVMVGGLLLEVATAATEIITAINLASLTQGLEPEQLTPPLFSGFYQLYFPWLTAPGQVLDAASITPNADQKKAYATTVPYLEDRTGRIDIVQRALTRAVGGDRMTMSTMVKLRWFLPAPASRPESLEKTFYGLKATPRIPFLRYFPAAGTGAPLLKLALHPDGSPVLSNPKVLAAYLNRPAPNIRNAVIVGRIPLPSTARVEEGAAFTLHMFEDGTSDITFEVPQRGATYLASVAAEAQRLMRELIPILGYPVTTTELQLRDMLATYKWSHPNPQTAAPITAARIRARVAALTPFLEAAPLLAEEKAMAAFTWKAVSNYETESAQFAYITQMVLRAEKEGPPGGGDPAAAHAAYVEDIATRFGVTEEIAIAMMERWMERRGEAVAPAPGKPAAVKAVPIHAVGTRIAISGAHPEYTIELHGVSSYTELQRIVSVVGILLGAKETELSLTPAPTTMTVLSEAVASQDKATVVAATTGGGSAAPVEEAVEEDGFDFQDILGNIGFDIMGNVDAEAEAEENTGAVERKEPETDDERKEDDSAAVGPDINAAVATVEEECRGNPWTKSDPALTVNPDWYISRLQGLDKVMFGYPASKTKRIGAYSKTCQRRDGRQPNIMTLAEYSRIRRCYDDRVRFVDLPPRKPEDLPNDPAYKPGKKYPDSYYLTDPDTKRPMWTVYNYENKTTPGNYVFLMCAPLWCERDNLPLLPAEYAGTQGRGFIKPPNTCPFCGGKEFANIATPQPGESVIVRNVKGDTKKLHAFVGTITRKKHPYGGYPLPCCDTTPRMLKMYMTAAATGTLVLGQDLAAGEEAGSVFGDGEEADEESVVEPDQLETASVVTGTTLTGTISGVTGPIDYRHLMDTIKSQYILGIDKVLSAGKFGLLTPALDAFFGQNGASFLESMGIRTTFKKNATVFFRLGVDYRPRTLGLNLFAGLAPFLGHDSAEETQAAFLSLHAARAFESANYGTLLQEFATRPTLPVTDVALNAFATEYGYPLDTARAHVTRVFRAWNSWLAYISDVFEPKQLRHIEHMLAQPGVVTPRGLLLVVLEQGTDGKIHVACPSFGIPPASQFGAVPVAFIHHDKRTHRWDPILLYNDTASATTASRVSFLFGERRPELEALPPDFREQVSQWITTWRSSSLGCGRGVPPPHVWTPAKNTAGLPRLRDFMVGPLGGYVTKLVRDRSNRLVGVMRPYFVPCLDDGTLATETPRIYEVEPTLTTPLAEMLVHYTELATRFPSLRPTNLVVRIQETTTVIGFRVAIGTLIATPPEPFNADALPPLPVQQMDRFPWELDALILRAPDAPPVPAVVLEESVASVEEQMAEAYQHLRLSFSKWLSRSPGGNRLKIEINEQFLKRTTLPLYERQKRLDLMLEPFIRKMVVATIAEEGAATAAVRSPLRKSLPLLRQDCITLSESRCKAADACRWSGGRCYIHAPTTAEATDPARIFTARLTDELLRYAGHRREIFNEEVPEIRTPKGIVRVGNELYMTTRPKEGAESVIERLGFTGEREASFPEEILRLSGLEEEADALATTATTDVIVRSQPLIRDYADDKLPASWTTMGFVIPSPDPRLPDPRAAAFYAVTGKGRREWEGPIQARRDPPDSTTPLNWGPRDMLALTKIYPIQLAFISAGRIQRLIRNPAKPHLATAIFWGPKQLLLSRGASWFFVPKDLPPDLNTALQLAEPLTIEEIKQGPIAITGGGSAVGEAGPAGASAPRMSVT